MTDPRIWVIEPDVTPEQHDTPKRRWFNQYRCAVKSGITTMCCNKSYDFGALFFSCCPATFDTKGAAIKDGEATVANYIKDYGEERIFFEGTFEVDL